MIKQKIVPCLWFDTQAEEAAKFYASVFPDSSVGEITHYGKAGHDIHGKPDGSVLTALVSISGYELLLLNGGSLFTMNPSVSYLVSCDSVEEVDALWATLSEGGSIMMELGAYPFNERYGWTADRYGVSWQVIYTGGSAVRQKIVPMQLFVGDVAGKAEEAIRFYASVFEGSVDSVEKFGAGEAPEIEGTVRQAAYTLAGQRFNAMDSAHAHQFAFSLATSFIVRCDDQEEIDRYWHALSADPKEEQCGWLKDRYGFSWQISPNELDEMLRSPDVKQVARVTDAFMAMKKFDLAALRVAYEGR